MGSPTGDASRIIGGRAIDGRLGEATEAAVREFQRKHGLNDTGAVSTVVWRQLVLNGS